MDRQEVEQRMDPLLVQFIEAKDEAEAREHLDQLIACAIPLVEKITNRNAHEDDFQEAMQQVIKALWDCKADPAGRGIRDYEHYVSVITANVRRKRIRGQHPEQQALKDSLRHALNRETKFALWDGRNRETVCGLAAWRGLDSAASEQLTQLLDQPLACEDAILPGRNAQCVERVELLNAIFMWLGHPVGFNDLVGIVFDLKRIVELTQVSDSDEEDARQWNELLESPEPLPDEEAEAKEFLAHLWAGIELLSPHQRIAYLLNFTDANGWLDVFWTYGVTRIQRIGATVRLSDEQFTRLWLELLPDDAARQHAESLKSYDEKFALLWRYWPLRDEVIARMLGKDRQKVINLRAAACRKLAKRLAAWRPRS